MLSSIYSTNSAVSMSNVELISHLTDRIEELRASMRLTKQDFCSSIGFSLSNYANITGARRSKPTAELVASIVERTEVNADWLLTGRGEMFAGGEMSKPAPEEPAQGWRGTISLADEEVELILNHRTLDEDSRQDLKEWLRYRAHIAIAGEDHQADTPPGRPGTAVPAQAKSGRVSEKRT